MRKNELVVGAVQLSSQGDVGENLDRCEELCERARARGAELIVLPENFAFVGAEEDRRTLAEALGAEAGPIQERLAGIARSSGGRVVAGGLSRGQSARL